MKPAATAMKNSPDQKSFGERTRITLTCHASRRLVSRFRSSHTIAVTSDANFGINGTLASISAALGPEQRALQPVVAPEQLTVAGGEARCTEHAEPLCCFDLRPQARLDVIRLGRFER